MLCTGNRTEGSNPSRSVEKPLFYRGFFISRVPHGRTIKHFVGWIGHDSDVETITASKLEAFFGYVSQQVAEAKWTTATATGIFMTARQFIRRLAELGVILLPGNIGSRRFRFGSGATR